MSMLYFKCRPELQVSFGAYGRERLRPLCGPKQDSTGRVSQCVLGKHNGAGTAETDQDILFLRGPNVRYGDIVQGSNL